MAVYLYCKKDDLKRPPRLTGCGTQHPHRALGGTRVLLAAAPTTPPCFRHWRRSSSLLGIVSGNSILDFGAVERLRAFRCSFFHRRSRDGKRQVQRRFLRKRGAADIPGNCHTKQKSHRFCISASTMASYWSGRRGSNSLPPPWQGGALPDELRPHIRCIYPCTLPFFNGAFAMNCVKKEKVLHDFRRGASDRNRTNDTGIFSPLLYRLSYRGKYDPDRARTDDPQRDRLVL